MFVVQSGCQYAKFHDINALRIASLNVGTLKDRSSEVVETMPRRRIDLCCIPECRWRDTSARMIDGKDSKCFGSVANQVKGVLEYYWQRSG